MNRERKLRTILLIYLVIPFTVTTLFLVFGIFTVTQTIRSHYYRQATSQAHQLVRGYALGIARTLDAEKIINELIEEKLLIASETTARHARVTKSSQLVDLAVHLHVDEISYYDAQGLVVYSNIPDLVGWQATADHPALLLHRGTGQAEETIRVNPVTGSVCKYAWFLALNDYVVEIGCRIDKILPILNGFSVERMIREIQADTAIVRVCFIDGSGTIVAASDAGAIGTRLAETAVLSAVRRGESIGQPVRLGSLPAYETYTPVHFDDDRIGTLMICHSLTGMDRVICTCSLIVIGVMLIAYGSMYLTVLTSHRKNRCRVERAYIDELTGLPNTVDLYESVAHCLNRISQQPPAILLVGFRDFTSINLKLGYSLADQVIRRAARTIRAVETEHCRVFRFNAEKFAILMKDLPREKLEDTARTIQALFQSPEAVEAIKHQLITHIGIHQLTDPQQQPEQALRCADMALTQAKNNPNGLFAFYHDAMEAALLREEAIENELIEIINRPDPQRFCLYYQPLVDFRTDRIIGFEALARLFSPRFGAVPPQEFIRIAEDRNLIIGLGTQILRTACHFLRSLSQAGHSGIKVAVNLSVIQLLDSAFVDTVRQVLGETGAAAADLELEITESVIADNFSQINTVLQTLKALGVQAALDDFGKGYSSFIRLSELQVATLKIDRYFINTISTAGHSDSITGSIIAMAHQIGLRVVAEGVEQTAQKEFLRASGCDIMQGYLFSRPVPEQEAGSLL